MPKVNLNVRNRFKEDLKLRNLAPLTQKIYLERVDSFFEYHNKNLILLEPNDIRGYLVYLQKEKKLAPNTINQYAAALTFFVNKTLGYGWHKDSIPKAKKIIKHPVTLTKNEVGLLLTALSNIKHRAILTTIYSTGIRVSEAANLKVDDIDSDRMFLYINQGKGRKDRKAILSCSTNQIMRLKNNGWCIQKSHLRNLNMYSNIWQDIHTVLPYQTSV